MLERMDTLLTDLRKRREYTLTEIIMAAVVMFLFREGSRHAFNPDYALEK